MRKSIRAAIAGNPNSGKSTLFNNLTGARQHVGNYPGVTVEKKEGTFVWEKTEVTVVDLPGTYGLSGGSEDEKVARNYLLNEKPDLIVHVVDASNLERNLYLTTQLMELEIPLILAMNMTDLVLRNQQVIDYEKLETILGVPVVQTIGNKNRGTRDLARAMVKAFEKRSGKFQKPGVDYGPEISGAMERMEEKIRNCPLIVQKFPVRWIALQYLAGECFFEEMPVEKDQENLLLKTAAEERKSMTRFFPIPLEVVLAEKRYAFAGDICDRVLTGKSEKRAGMTDAIDQIVLDRIWGLPIFALVMYAIFKFTFTLSEPVVGGFEAGFEALAGIAEALIPEGVLQSLVVDGIIGGVGGVLGFFPLVLFMFFAIAFFEDSGYMARAAFVMDKLMSRFGLHGKSFLPMMISTNGCAVPGLMATRTLESPKERLITMMVVPFMICGAKLPIFALFIAAFFPDDQQASMMFLMYAMSVFLALASAWTLKRFVLPGEAAHFVMELPPYRLPTIHGLFLKMWERGWLYLKKAGSIILFLSVIIWAAFKFPETDVPSGVSAEAAAAYQIQHSYAGQAGEFMEPVLKPIGMEGNAGIALIAGLAAKEVVVSTLGTVYSLGEIDPENPETLQEKIAKDPAWSPLKAISFLMFCLIYAPCIVALAVFYREAGSKMKWLLFLILWTTVMAWGASFIVYQAGMILGWGV